MTYVDLGQYTAKTGKDLTGQNIGNITSVLNLSAIQVPYFECYRLLISTPLVPGTLPAIVQTTSGSTLSSFATLNLTFAKPTTVGNTIVVVTGSNASGTIPSQSACTIGGAADHFGNIAGATNNGGGGENASTWVCPATTQASTAVVATFSGGSGNGSLFGYAYELSGCLNTTSATSAVDISGNATSGAGNVSVLNTTSGTTASANDFFIGFQSEFNATNNPAMTTGTTTPAMTNLAQLAGSPAPGFYFSAMSSWGLTGIVGQTLKYNAMTSIAGNLTAPMLGLFPAAGAAAGLTAPFTVTIDGKVWDNQTTVPGVGYTFPMQQPMCLNEGNTLQIFWPTLTAAQYATYSNLFSIQAWFRYDPSIQRRG